MEVMKVVIGLFLFVCLSHGKPAQPFFDYSKAVVTKYTNDHNAQGEYSYDVHGSDGQQRGETRTVENPGTPQEKAVVTGYYYYMDANGNPHLVGYKADENGFQPEGENLVPSASVKRQRPTLGIPSSAVASLAGGGLGR